MKPTPETFHCKCRSACCRIPDGIVRVSEAEITRIAKFLGMDEATFISNETELAPDRRGLILKNTTEVVCVHLASDSLCRINPVKPDKCRTFSFEWTNANSASVCPKLNRLASSRVRSTP